MILFYLDYLLLFRHIRYYRSTCASEVLFKLIKGKGQFWPKVAKNRENRMLFKMNSKENGKRNPKFDFIFGFTMKFYITSLPGFFNTINDSCLAMTSHYV